MVVSSQSTTAASSGPSWRNRTLAKWKSPWMIPGRKVVWAASSSQVAYLLHAGMSRPGIAVHGRIGLQLAPPPSHLALQIALGLAQVGEPEGFVVEPAQGGDGLRPWTGPGGHGCRDRPQQGAAGRWSG